MTPQLYWIPGPWRGKLAITSRPRGGDWLEEEIRGWRDAGINVVVSLLEPEEVEDLGLTQENVLTHQAGMQLISFPITDRGIPESLTATHALLRRLRQELGAGRNLAIHCRQSVGRSSLIAAALLIAEGRNARDALDAVAAARMLPVPETMEQQAWVSQFAAGQLARVTS